MNFSLSRSPEPWLALRRDITLDDLCSRILTADICLSDLDDTDADSPAKKIAFHHIGGNFDPLAYALWCLDTVMEHALHGKITESAQWEKYVKNFLKYPGARAAVTGLFTPEFVTASLYPGVQELYALLQAQKWYVTRNIDEVATAYGKALEFQGALTEVDNKEKAVEQFVNDHPEFRRYFIKGDSLEDNRMLDALSFCQSRGKIDSVVSCYRADNPAKVNHRFDANVGKDYRKLVEVLNSRNNP